MVCVKVLDTYGYKGTTLEQGRVYVIRATHPGLSEWEIAVEGIRYPHSNGPYWFYTQFRPLVPKSQSEDASMFRELVDGMDPMKRVNYVRELLDQ